MLDSSLWKGLSIGEDKDLEDGADSRGARRSQRLTLLPLGPFVQRGA